MKVSRFSEGIGRSRIGASLVEIIVALGVLSVAVLAVMGLFPVAANAAQKAEDLQFAGSLAATDLENCRTENFDEITDGSYVTWRKARTSSGAQQFHIFRRVTLGPVSGLKIVEVQVEWGSDTSVKPERYSLETAVHRVYQ